MAITYDPIQTITSNGTSNTMSFTTIPSTYTDLIFTGNYVASSGTAYSYVRLNNTAGANYNNAYTTYLGTTISSPAYQVGTTSYFPNNGLAANYGANGAAVFYAELSNYADTNKMKIWTSQFFSAQGTANNAELGLLTGTFLVTSAIDRVDFIQSAANFANGSSITMWGVLRA